ncbi:hypothetical protein PV10_02154 [Exophiala mesophila]|uniref:ABC transporter domain-containing protein n=1 Tax=Exophiala mesophila TaxID=212818 RepID=A0A0D1ZIF8_EXOME|nr:uncharacterized protein PV10_02154 [Exophiala mesophila]KIV94382.1 hypothetical protein PV10_02154 [Exophiala mesophila]
MHLHGYPVALLAAGFVLTAAGFRNDTSPALTQTPLYGLTDGCPPCPRCFDCHYDEFHCQQFANCSSLNGKCVCPPGFGGDDCSEPLCGSLADGKNRSPRQGDHCDCKDGWEGVNCNVCTTNDACDAMTLFGRGGVCYQKGLVVHENYQMCNVTNQAILDQIKPRIPQVTFSCNADDATCNFQFWVDQKESFYCALDTCAWEAADTTVRNTTKYTCEHIKCSCIEDRFLCGEDGSVNIDEFLAEEIKGPASFFTQHTYGGSSKDGSRFEEPAMNNLISMIFGDEYISLSCRAGECLYEEDVPGYTPPIKEINTPVIAGVIAAVALLILAIILGSWYLSRRAALKRWGAIRLGDNSEDDPSKAMINNTPMALQFENLHYNLKGKEILSGISGIAQPGQIMAIMGASGAGKSTFLDILARKNKRGQVSGNMYVNGEKILDNEYRNVIGFVDQEDTLLPTLTVHETILTSALLRLPADMGVTIKEQRVIEVMQQLGIYHIKDQQIGSEEGNGRGISGGEKRRVGIACELVTSPSILFLDEPTSGLDAFNAFNVVECLVTLAKTYNRTVIFTIHQPRSNIVALFDQLVLLAKGQTVYSGPFSNCQAYFDHVGYSCPPGFNIADYLVDLTMHASMPKPIILDDVNQDFVERERDGLGTSSSSTRAVKSIASASNVSIDTHREPSIRPKQKRRISLKQKQDRQLFTRKKTSGDETPPTPKTDDEDNVLYRATGSMRSWLQLSKRDGSNPPQILEDPDDLLPDVNTDLDILVSSFKASDVAQTIHDEIATSIHAASSANGQISEGESSEAVTGSIKGFRRVSLPRQFLILSKRTWRNLYRNPILMLTHYAIAIVLAVFSGYLFYGVTDDIGGFQNRLGLFFFLLALFGFSTLTSLNVFSSERLLFVRERANGYYSPITYFAAKVIFDIIPLRLIPPIIMGIIVYPMTGLVPAWSNFLTFILILVLFNLAAATICLTIGIVFKDGAVANLIGSLVMLFSLLFAGLLLNLNHDDVTAPLQWLEKLSFFHYGYEALLVNEVAKLRLIDRRYGLDIEVPGASILSAFGFDNLALWRDVMGLGVFGGVFIIVAYAAMHFLLVEKR